MGGEVQPWFLHAVELTQGNFSNDDGKENGNRIYFLSQLCRELGSSLKSENS